MSANRIDNLANEYNRKGIPVKWVVIGNTEIDVRENQTFFIKRYLLNESRNKDLIVISLDGMAITQHKADPNKYEYRGNRLVLEGFGDTYYENASISALSLDHEEITISGFAERHSVWIKDKQSAFESRINELKDEEKQRRDAIYNRLHESHTSTYRRTPDVKYQDNPLPGFQNPTTYAHQNVDQDSSDNEEYEKCKQEILPLIDQKQTQVRDSKENRWVKCEKCGHIGRADKDFVSYGGSNHVNLGVCYSCRER